jgi:hypothetical protein
MFCESCWPTVQNCQECIFNMTAQVPVCLSCWSGYLLDANGQCVRSFCPYDSVSEDDGTCTPCKSYFPHCQYCQRRLNVTVSDPNYAEPVLTDYTETIQVTQCMYCDNWMSPLADGTCSPCTAYQWLDASTQQCYTCSDTMPNCMQCRNASVCSYCQYGYTLDANGTCYACELITPHCQSCSANYFNGNLRCDWCVYGMSLDTASGACTDCNTITPGCAYCYSGTCQWCQYGLFLYYNSTDGSNTCQPCSKFVDGCQGCYQNYVYQYYGGSMYESKVVYCYQCVSGLYYDAKQEACISCASQMPGCNQCYSESYYTLVFTEFIQATTLRCQSCSEGFMYDELAGVCVACSEQLYNCKQCYQTYNYTNLWDFVY